MNDLQHYAQIGSAICQLTVTMAQMPLSASREKEIGLEAAKRLLALLPSKPAGELVVIKGGVN